MSFLRISLKNALRAQAASWRTWLLLLLLPALTFGARLALPAEEAATPVQVGVVLPARGGEEFWDRLDRRSGLVVTFRQAAADQAERQVAAGRWDCALGLREDFGSGWSGGIPTSCSPCWLAPAPPSIPWCGRRSCPVWPS